MTEFKGKLLSYKDYEYLTDMIRETGRRRNRSRTIIINRKRREREEVHMSLTTIRDRGFIWDVELNFVNGCKKWFLENAFKNFTPDFIYKPFWWDSKNRFIDNFPLCPAPYCSDSIQTRKRYKHDKIDNL
jgi:hypothetical protein